MAVPALRLLARSILVLLLALLCAPLRADMSTAVAESVRQRLERLAKDAPLRVGGTDVASAKVLRALYEDNAYRPFWLRDEAVADLLATLRGIDGDGLRPEDYHLGTLERLRAQVVADGSTEQMADLELLLTDSLSLLLQHLTLGKVDPVTLHGQWDVQARSVTGPDLQHALRTALRSGVIAGAVARARPDHPYYERGRAALARYRAIAARGGWEPVAPGRTLVVGMLDARVPSLRRRLFVEQDFAGDLDPELFDEALDDAVRRLQRRHQLMPDGAVGPLTLAALNVTVEQRIEQIRVNLERARWVMHAIRGELLLVDIAGFKATYFRADQPVWSTRVIVGRHYRRTPVFKAQIQRLVINPPWTVPPGILRNDVLSQLRRDRNYLERQNMQIVDRDGRLVDPAMINLAPVSAGTFPYTVRQQPGAKNALGELKIEFPNPHMVYLHDTPARELFEAPERAFSSGCIRVERVFELAELLMGDAQRWNQASFATIVATGRTRVVPLPSPVVVILMYWTVDVTADGGVVFKRDIYGRDLPLLQALNVPFKSRAQSPAR